LWLCSAIMAGSAWGQGCKDNVLKTGLVSPDKGAVDPTAAVDPNDSQASVFTFTKASPPALPGSIVAYSLDGNNTFHELSIPLITNSTTFTTTGQAFNTIDANHAAQLTYVGGDSSGSNSIAYVNLSLSSQTFGPAITVATNGAGSNMSFLNPTIAVQNNPTSNTLFVSALNQSSSPTATNEVVVSESNDSGNTWTTASTPTAGHNPSRVGGLQFDGTLGLVAVNWEEPSGIAGVTLQWASISSDHGQTWTQHKMGARGTPFFANLTGPNDNGTQMTFTPIDSRFYFGYEDQVSSTNVQIKTFNCDNTLSNCTPPMEVGPATGFNWLPYIFSSPTSPNPGGTVFITLDHYSGALPVTSKELIVVSSNNGGISWSKSDLVFKPVLSTGTFFSSYQRGAALNDTAFLAWTTDQDKNGVPAGQLKFAATTFPSVTDTVSPNFPSSVIHNTPFTGVLNVNASSGTSWAMNTNFAGVNVLDVVSSTGITCTVSGKTLKCGDSSGGNGYIQLALEAPKIGTIKVTGKITAPACNTDSAGGNFNDTFPAN